MIFTLYRGRLCILYVMFDVQSSTFSNERCLSACNPLRRATSAAPMAFDHQNTTRHVSFASRATRSSFATHVIGSSSIACLSLSINHLNCTIPLGCDPSKHDTTFSRTRWQVGFVMSLGSRQDLLPQTFPLQASKWKLFPSLLRPNYLQDILKCFR